MINLRNVGRIAIGAGLAWTFASHSALAGKINDTLTWASEIELSTADIYYQNPRESVIIALNTCDSLLHRNYETDKYEPLLATSWNWVNELTLDVTLRQGVKFHNGKTLVAEDVAYTFRHISNPENTIVSPFKARWVKQVDVLAEDKVRFHLKAPTPAILDFLSVATPIYPAGHYDKAPEVAAADGRKRRDWGALVPVCTGPYKVTRVVPGQLVELTKNPDYFKGGPKGTPSIGKIVYRSIPNRETQIAELLTGSVDWLWSLPQDAAQRYAQMPQLTVQEAKTARFSFLQLDSQGNSGNAALKDVRVRRALNHAIDKAAIARTLVGREATVSYTPCYPAQTGCTDDVTKNITRYEYDPAKAKALLAEAGFANGFNITINGYRDRPIVEAIIGYLKAINVNVDLKYTQYGAWLPVYQQRKMEVAHATEGSQGVYDISASTAVYYKGGPDDYARDPEVIAWMEEGDQTSDPAKRNQIYAKVMERVTERAYMVPLINYVRFYAFSKDLDFKPSPDELAHFYYAKWK